MRPGWRDAVQTAGDLAIVGFVTTLAALPLVTAGAAVLTASRAIDHYLRLDSWPPGREVWADFRRSLLPGLAGSAVVVAVAGLLTMDALALHAGRVPGGPPMLTVVSLVGLAAAGFAGLVLVSAIRLPMLPAVRDAFRTAVARPGLLAGTAAVIVVAGVLTVLIHPVLIPVLLGHTLFGVQVLARRIPVVERV